MEIFVASEHCFVLQLQKVLADDTRPDSVAQCKAIDCFQYIDVYSNYLRELIKCKIGRKLAIDKYTKIIKLT